MPVLVFASAGTGLDSRFGNVLDSLVQDDLKADDPELVPFSTEELARWKEMRKSALFNPMFGNAFGLLVGSSGLVGKRHTMEDEVSIIPDLNAAMALPITMRDHAYFAVYDGHEGSEVSKLLTEKLHVYLCDMPEFDRDPSAALVNACLVRASCCFQELAGSFCGLRGRVLACCCALRPR